MMAKVVPRGVQNVFTGNIEKSPTLNHLKFRTWLKSKPWKRTEMRDGAAPETWTPTLSGANGITMPSLMIYQWNYWQFKGYSSALEVSATALRLTSAGAEPVCI